MQLQDKNSNGNSDVFIKVTERFNDWNTNARGVIDPHSEKETKVGDHVFKIWTENCDYTFCRI